MFSVGWHAHSLNDWRMKYLNDKIISIRYTIWTRTSLWAPGDYRACLFRKPKSVTTWCRLFAAHLAEYDRDQSTQQQ